MTKLLHFEFSHTPSTLNLNLRAYINNNEDGSMVQNNIEIQDNERLITQIQNCQNLNTEFQSLQDTYLSNWKKNNEVPNLLNLRQTQDNLIESTNNLFNESGYIEKIQPSMLRCLSSNIEQDSNINPVLLVNAEDTQTPYKRMLWQTPFHEWKLFNNQQFMLNNSYQAEVMFASRGLIRITTSSIKQNNRGKVTIIIVLGNAVNSEETNLIISELSSSSLIRKNTKIICFCQQTENEINFDNNIEYITYNSFSDVANQLNRRYWDILFFTSHSNTTNIQLNNENSEMTASMEIDENGGSGVNLFRHLRQAINNTYRKNKPTRLIVINSCDGLGFVPEIINNQIKISHAVVMRYPIPVRQARQFFRQFIENFIRYETLPSAMWQTREWLNQQEVNEIPGLRWLPVAFCANDIESPFLTFNMLRSPRSTFIERQIKSLIANLSAEGNSILLLYQRFIFRFLLGLQLSIILALLNQSNKAIQLIIIIGLLLLLFRLLVCPLLTIQNRLENLRHTQNYIFWIYFLSIILLDVFILFCLSKIKLISFLGICFFIILLIQVVAPLIDCLRN